MVSLLRFKLSFREHRCQLSILGYVNRDCLPAIENTESHSHDSKGDLQTAHCDILFDLCIALY